MTPQRGNNNNDIQSLMTYFSDSQKAMTAKLERIEEKIGLQATRAEMEKLRSEMIDKLERVEKGQSVNFVEKANYELRHTSLIERDDRLQLQLQKLADAFEAWKAYEDGRFESSSNKSRELVDDQRDDFEERIKELEDKKLSERDRTFVRIGQFGGIAALIVSIITFLVQHIHIQ